MIGEKGKNQKADSGTEKTMCVQEEREGTYLTDEKNEQAFTRIEQAGLFCDMTHERGEDGGMKGRARSKMKGENRVRILILPLFGPLPGATGTTGEQEEGGGEESGEEW